MITVYGLPNCDTTVAAIKWLQAKGYTVSLHNYKTEGVSEAKLTAWSNNVGWQKLLNKRSTTWRSLTPQVQNSITDEASAVAIMQQHTSLIKRPVIEFAGKILVGFDEELLLQIFC
jgi:arsenate reductase (glutaredoxin)